MQDVEKQYFDLISQAVELICEKEESTRDTSLESFEMYKDRINLEAIKGAKANLSAWKGAFEVVINELAAKGDQYAIQQLIQGIDKIQKWYGGKQKETKETLANLFGYDISLMEKMYQIGRDAFEKGHNADASKVFGLLVTLDPGYAICWTALGIILHAERQFKESLFAFGMASQLDEQNPLTYLYSARCYKQLGMKKEAEDALKHALAYASGKQQYRAVVQSIKAEQAKV